jgi:hypothetical protein
MKQLCEKTNFLIRAFFQELPVIDLMYSYIEFTDRLVQQIVEKKQSYYHICILEK